MTRLPPSARPTPPPGLKLRIVVKRGDWLGLGKADLMEFIAQTGSISAAGRKMGISYKRAWGLVEVLNKMFATPLVTASRGGAGHGGAELTPTGREVLALFRSMQAKAPKAVAAELEALSKNLRYFRPFITLAESLSMLRSRRKIHESPHEGQGDIP